MPKILKETSASQSESKSEWLWTRFIPIGGYVLALLIPLLQSNGVEVNWWESAIAYATLLTVILWSFWAHAMPTAPIVRKMPSAIALAIPFCLIGAFATVKQWNREHSDNLELVKINDVMALPDSIGKPHIFQIDIENNSHLSIQAILSCTVFKPQVPVKPFGILAEDSKLERAVENNLFRQFDAKEERHQLGANEQQDLVAQATVHVYCPSPWMLLTRKSRH